MVKVLVADDDRHIRELVKDVLTDDGYEVIEAKDGSEAIVKARDALPDLILLDVEMPVLDGFDVLKRHEETESIPVVMLTVLPPLNGEEEAMRLGVNHYVRKPWSNDMLTATVRVALRERQSVAGEQGGDPTASGARPIKKRPFLNLPQSLGSATS